MYRNRLTHKIPMTMKNVSFRRYAGFWLLMLLPVLVVAQQDKKNGVLWMHHEQMDDPYLANPDEGTKVSPAYHSRDEFFYTIQVNTNQFGQNILNDAANEPSITVDPTDPGRIIIGWRQFDNVSSSFRQAGIAVSQDGGETWANVGPIDPGAFRTDPVLDSDTEGNLYYNSLTVDGGDYLCDVFKIAAGGFEWDDGTFAQGGDKQWMVIDKTSGPGQGNIYSFWTQAYSYCYPGNFTRSANGGMSYEDCITADGDPHWGTMDIGPGGELYIVGAGSYDGVVVIKSSNAQYAGSSISWDFVKYVSLDGQLTGWTPINPQGLLGQANICVDTSGGSGNGNVYVLASVERNGSSDPGDVMFAKSTDGGLTWNDPVRVNDDESTANYQWFGTMSVAPNGRIDVVWLDTRDDNPGQYWSSLYYSFSYDQGETWSVNSRLSLAFDPHVGWPNQNKMGDYFDMVSDNQFAHLAWANTLNNEQDVYYGRISLFAVSVEERKNSNIRSFSVYPNPANDRTTVEYELIAGAFVEISIYDVFGHKMRNIVYERKPAGNYRQNVDLDDLPGGVYLCRLLAGDYRQTIRLAVVK